MKIILTADDFGCSAEINKAVAACFERGFCSSASLMMNMPFSAEACQIAHDKKIDDCMSVHIVLRDGEPVSEEIKGFSRFCNKDGLLDLSFLNRQGPLEPSEARVLAGEIRAQIKKMKGFGVNPISINSHLNFHLRWYLMKVFAVVAKEEGIPCMRFSQNVWPVPMPAFVWLKTMAIDCIQRSSCFKAADYYAPFEEFVQMLKSGRRFRENSSIACNFHPCYDEKLGLVNIIYSKRDTGLEEMMKFVKDGRKLISFRDLIGKSRE